MKSRFASAAALCFCTSAFAQSSITFFGVIDTGYASIKSSGAARVSGIVTGGSSTSRYGFRGVEDLGGGLTAGFWLESQVNSDTGAGTASGGGIDFTRRSTVSLSGRLGEFRLGRDFAPTYLNMISFDAWSQRGLGMIEYPGYSSAGVASFFRNSNGIAYFLPSSLGGIYGSVQYAFPEQSSAENSNGIANTALAATTKKTGSYAGARLGYASGPLNVSASYGAFIDAVRNISGMQYYASDYTIGNFGLSYDLGVVKPLVLFQRERIDGRENIPNFGLDTFAIGATAPVGTGQIRVSASKYNYKNSTNNFKKFSMGYVHDLSKRTALYADISHIRNNETGRASFGGLGGSIISPTPTSGGNSTGFSFGMKHSF